MVGLTEWFSLLSFWFPVHCIARLWQATRGKNVFNLIQKLMQADRTLALVAMIVAFRRFNRVTMPATVQLVTGIETLAIMDQRQVRRIEPVIAIDLDEQLRGNDKPGLEQRRGQFEEFKSQEIGPCLDFVLQRVVQLVDVHCDSNMRMRAISSCMSEIPVTANSQSK